MSQGQTRPSLMDSATLEKAHDATEAGEIGQTPSHQDSSTPASKGPTMSTTEGGLKAWLAVAGASAALFTSFGWCNCLGLFLAEYVENQLRGHSSTTVSWITSMEFFFLLIGSPVAGKLFDCFGPRMPLLIGSFLHVFGLMMTSLSSKYYQFLLAQSICSGIGTSLIFTPCMMAPQTYFRVRRGLVGGLVVAGSSLGGVIFPLMVQHLIPEVGFAWTMRICAFLIIALLVFANLTVTSNLTHSPKRFSIMDYIRPFKEPNFAIMAVASFFMYWGLFVPFTDIVIAAQHYGVPTHLALDLVPIMNGASFIGRTVPNMIADRIGRFNVVFIMTLASALLCIALWLPGQGTGANIAFAVLFGISSGAVIGLGPVLIMSISPMREAGTRMGTIMAIAAVGTLTSPPIGTAIAEAAGGTYVYTALFAGICFLISAAGIWLLRTRLKGWALSTKV